MDNEIKGPNLRGGSGIGEYYRIRFNTKFAETEGKRLKWRILDSKGGEHLAKEIRVKGELFTTEDEIAPGVMKYHIACYGHLTMKDEIASIVS